MVEVLFAAVIGCYVIMAVWSVCIMTWRWWAEITPRLELEKAARLTLLSVIEGKIDSSVGSYTAGPTTYTRRNGIAWAIAYPTISSDAKTISYRLVPDSSNIRQFYYGTYGGDGYIFYKNNSGTVTRIDSTKGVTNIQFSKLPDPSNPSGPPYDNIIQVVVTAERDILGTRSSPYHVKVQYTDTVFLRNAL